MRALLSRIATPLIVAGIGAACGGDGGSGLGSSVLTTLEVTPATATLFTVAPGNTVTLSVVAKDQDGATMSGSPSFSSDNSSIAAVGADGTVTGVGPGSAGITASLTAGEVTKTATATVTVQAAAATAGVVAPAFEFQPGTVDVAAGGAVTWSFGSIHHTVSFTTAGAPESIPELENGSASRTFANNGIFGYRCLIHPEMTGLVRVH
jgi:plastocyanin